MTSGPVLVTRRYPGGRLHNDAWAIHASRWFIDHFVIVNVEHVEHVEHVDNYDRALDNAPCATADATSDDTAHHGHDDSTRAPGNAAITEAHT
jgi:hypothetical protein